MSAFKDVFEAAEKGTVEDVKYFIEQKGVSVNARNNIGANHPIIDYAWLSDNAEVIKYLASKGAEIEPYRIIDAAGMKRGSVETIQLLLDKGFDINYRDSGLFPLLIAASSNNMEAAKFLLSKGADISMASSTTGLTSLLIAKENGHTEMVKFLTEEEQKKLEQGTLSGKIDDGRTWTYTGGILNGLEHGKGKLVWSDGAVYEGDWAGGNEHGKGKSTFADGSCYEGDWANGLRHGKGKFTFANGEVNEGDFVEGLPNGKIKMTAVSGESYEGDIVDGKRHGKGKWILENGNFYEGEFADDKPTIGRGKATHSDGSVYEGGIVNGVAHGKGKLILANGDVFEGDFVNDAAKYGKVTFADGRVVEGNLDDIMNALDANDELIREKKELKTILICSAVFLVIGLIMGISSGDDSGIFFGIWLGIGFGGAVSVFGLIPYMFKNTYREEGCIKAVEGFFKNLAFLIIGFTIAGPIGLLVRVIRKLGKIKKLK